MAKLGEAFDAVGIVRRLKEAAGEGAVTTFDFEVGKLAIPCHAKHRLPRPPRAGESARVVGTWMVDDRRLVCVEVQAVYPAEYSVR